MAGDVARQAMEQASLVVGEINIRIRRTFGDTSVHVSDFRHLVLATDPPYYFDRWPVDPVFDQVAANVADLVEDRSCIAFSIEPLFDALSRHLSKKRHLGVHSPFPLNDGFRQALKIYRLHMRRWNYENQGALH